MTNIFLYLVTSFIWGSTWLAIQFQLSNVSPIWSVTYRFGIAASILIGFCLLTQRRLHFTFQQHKWIALQGLLLFSLNYILYYYGSHYFISGVVAVIFASIIIMNIINSRIFFGAPLVKRVLIGAGIGLSGLVVIFWSQFASIHIAQLSDLLPIIKGVSISVIATLFASFGNMVSNRLQKQQLPIVSCNALGMAYGTLFTLLIAIITKQPLTFDTSFAYLSSLLYLSLFGSVFAFGAYLNLLGRIGPERAAYAFVLLPIIAMILSTIFESFTWTISTYAGIALVIWGNILVLTKKPIAIDLKITTQQTAIPATE